MLLSEREGERERRNKVWFIYGYVSNIGRAWISHLRGSEIIVDKQHGLLPLMRRLWVNSLSLSIGLLSYSFSCFTDLFSLLSRYGLIVAVGNQLLSKRETELLQKFDWFSFHHIWIMNFLHAAAVFYSLNNVSFLSLLSLGILRTETETNMIFQSTKFHDYSIFH